MQIFPDKNLVFSFFITFFSNGTLTILTISFKDSQFLTLKRAETYSMTNLVATCGGLLGLFMGISLLSLIEMIVYCAVRIAYKLTTRKKHHMTQKRIAIQQNHVNVLPPVD